MLQGLVDMIMVCFYMLKLASDSNFYLLLKKTSRILIASARIDPCTYNEVKAFRDKRLLVTENYLDAHANVTLCLIRSDV